MTTLSRPQRPSEQSYAAAFVRAASRRYHRPTPYSIGDPIYRTGYCLDCVRQDGERGAILASATREGVGSFEIDVRHRIRQQIVRYATPGYTVPRGPVGGESDDLSFARRDR